MFRASRGGGESTWWRRWLTSCAMVLCALMVAAADVGRIPAADAATPLKPGDLLYGLSEEVRAFDPATGATRTVLLDRRLSGPLLIATGPNGDIYVADPTYIVDDFTAGPTILRVDPLRGTATIVTTGGFNDFTGLAVDLAGSIIVSILGESHLIRVGPATGRRSPITTERSLRDAYGPVVERDGSILVTARNIDGTPGRQIIRIRAGTGTLEVVASTGGLLRGIFFIAVGPDGTIFVANPPGNISPADIVRIDPRTGAQRLVTQFERITTQDMVVDSSGQLYALVAGGSLYRVDPESGQQTGIAVGLRGLAIVKVGAPLPCPTRSPVSVRATPIGNGRLQVIVRVAGSENAVRRITLGRVPDNAVVEGAPTISGAEAGFVLRRTGPGAVTLPFTVTDGCGDWRTFVGGGPNAF